MELLAGISLAAIEQWGNSWSGYTGVFNWYFPISPSQVYAACLTKHTKNISSSHNWEPARVEEWNNSYARIHPDGDLGYSVIAICKAQQQWGFTVFDPVYYKNVNFTLPLSVNGTFCAFSTGYDAKVSTFLWHSMSHFNNVNVGVTGFVFDSRYTFTGLGYLAICWQKQWRNNPGLWAIPFTEFVAGGITMTRTGSQSSGTWYGDSGTISLTGYTASCATNESWVSNISGSAIAVGL